MDFLISQYYDPSRCSTGHGSLFLTEIEKLSPKSGVSISVGRPKSFLWAADDVKEQTYRKIMMFFRIIRPIAKYTDGESSTYRTSRAGVVDFLINEYKFDPAPTPYKDKHDFFGLERTKDTKDIFPTFSKDRKPKLCTSFNKEEREFFKEMATEIMTIPEEDVASLGFAFSADSYEEAIRIFREKAVGCPGLIFGMAVSSCNKLYLECVNGSTLLSYDYRFLQDESYDFNFITYDKAAKDKILPLDAPEIGFGDYAFQDGDRSKTYFKPIFDWPTLFISNGRFFSNIPDVYYNFFSKVMLYILYERYSPKKLDELFSVLKEGNPGLKEIVFEIANIPFVGERITTHSEIYHPFYIDMNSKAHDNEYLMISADKDRTAIIAPVALSITAMIAPSNTERMLTRMIHKAKSAIGGTRAPDAWDCLNPKFKELTKADIHSMAYHGPGYIKLRLPKGVSLREFILNQKYKLMDGYKINEVIRVEGLRDCLSDDYMIKTIAGEEAVSIKEFASSRHPSKKGDDAP